MDRKTLRLTQRRAQWAAQRSNGAVFKGETLRPPAAVEARYSRALDVLVREMTSSTRKQVEALFRELHAQDYAEDATISSQSRILMAALRSQFNSLFAKQGKIFADAMMSATEKASAGNLHSSLEKLSGGLSLRTQLATPNTVNVYKALVAENVSLIKSIPADYLTQVEGSVMRSISNGNGLQDLIPALEKYEGVTHRRAQNIATDQTRKAYNGINKSRMQALNVQQYEWIHSGGGAHPREDHIEMSGKIYRFDDPPIIDQRTGERGIPGQAINCRCVMRPVFTALVPSQPEN